MRIFRKRHRLEISWTMKELKSSFFFTEKSVEKAGGGATSNKRRERRIKKNYFIICGLWAKRNPASLKTAGIFCAVIFAFLQRRHAVPRRAWLAEPQHGQPPDVCFCIFLLERFLMSSGLPAANPGESISV